LLQSDQYRVALEHIERVGNGVEGPQRLDQLSSRGSGDRLTYPAGRAESAVWEATYSSWRNGEYLSELEYHRRALAAIGLQAALAWACNRAGSSPPDARPDHPWHAAFNAVYGEARMEQANAVRCVLGNPFCEVALDSSWRTSTAVAIARGMYESREFAAMPILADALQDAGCDHAAVLDHCRGPGPHVRGCWVVDLVLGKQ
jgi:hypothetical protein